MYKIIGADKKEYGPVTIEVMRRWVTEGRVNAQTMVQAEGGSDWKPLSEYPELAEVLGAVPPVPPITPESGPALTPSEVILVREYSLDIGSCIARSWELVKAHFWPVVGISLLVLVAMGVINQLIGLFSGPATRSMILEHRISVDGIFLVLGTSILSTPVYSVLMGGLFKYYLKLIRGQRADVADAFSGFGSSLGQLALLGLVSGILSLLAYLLCILPGIYLNVCWIFAVPLVIDRKMQFWDAMELSRKVVSKHWFIVFAFLLVLGLVAICGLFACCIGLLVSMPISWVALMYGYEDLFGRQAS
jgi:uncharacterized membrane protein